VSNKLQTIIGDPPAPPPVPVADDAAAASFDPLRAELADAIRERAERADAIVVARKTVERLTAFLDRVEKRQPSSNIFGDSGPDEEVLRLAETARLRNPEMTPPSKERLARAAAEGELALARQALSLGQSRRAEADAALVATNERIERLIDQLFARDLPRRIADAKRVHDQFLSMAKVLAVTGGDMATLPADLRRIVTRICDDAEKRFCIPFDLDRVERPAGQWEAARAALRENPHALTPD
jgi:hypothetical protein